jgi:hypothetical protein
VTCAEVGDVGIGRGDDGGLVAARSGEASSGTTFASAMNVEKIVLTYGDIISTVGLPPAT